MSLCPRKAHQGRLGEEVATRAIHRGPGASTTPITRPQTCVQPTSIIEAFTEAPPRRTRSRTGTEHDDEEGIGTGSEQRE